MHRKQLRHVEDLLQIAALTRLGATRTSTPLVVKAPRLPVTAAGGLAFFSVAAVTDIVSHRGRYGPKTIRSDTYAADFPSNGAKIELGADRIKCHV